MPYAVPYATDTLRIPNAMIPGNETSDNPVEFDIAPAWGPDLARLRSVVSAADALSRDTGDNGSWTPAVQDATIKGFEVGAPAFANIILAIRGLTIPVQMALRAGVLPTIQPGMAADAQIPIMSGVDFSKVCGALIGMSMYVALQVVILSNKQEVDPRFFVQPSGSGGPGTGATRTTSAKGARKGSRKRATAAAH